MKPPRSVIDGKRAAWAACFIAGVASWGIRVEAAGIPHRGSPIPELSAPEVEVDAVGDVDGSNAAPQKALQDTIWIADWSFESGSYCSAAGWTHVDNHILNSGANYWHIETGFTTASGMTGRSVAVGQHGKLCCTEPDGYDNDWYQGIRMTYTGSATLSLDYIVDSEAQYDFLQIETDSLCLSYARVDFARFPWVRAADFRRVVAADDSLNLNGGWNVTLPAYGSGTDCLYIAFVSDRGFSPCDGNYRSTVGEAAVVDNIVLVDASGTRTEDFEDGTLDIGTYLDMADSEPFGTWARLYRHISDNDMCTENKTCAWLWTDYTTPTLYNDPSMAFGPGGYVVKGWLDDIIVSPWVGLATSPTAGATVLAFRRFPGNFFSTSRIVQCWSVRGKQPVGNQDCVSPWRPTFKWNSLSSFTWQSLRFDMTPEFEPAAAAIQVRFRTSDWQWIANAAPPAPYIPGPGPYVDRVRIGRLILPGPVISEGSDSRSQGQDCFASEISPVVTPAGEHFRPTTDRFGTCAFSQGTELGIGRTSRNLITGDSIHVQIVAQRPGGTVVASVTWSGAIVAGPHAGKAPPPHVVDANGFFTIAADSCRAPNGSAIADNYFVDLDDFYFRGGDVLLYFWAATDEGNGYSSDPAGLVAPPASIAEAEASTGGLFEVNYLPQINWAPAYIARIAADAHGKLDPTPAEVAASSQSNCILYVDNVNARRLSGDAQRTSFMYALDRLGYRGTYDVYDHQGMGNTNNQLGGRATIEQCQGYSLIIYDNGNGTPGRPLLPDGIAIDAEKIDQAGWFRRWLAQVPTLTSHFASLWILGSNTVQERSQNSLLRTDMGLELVRTDQGLTLNPEVVGVASFAFDQGLGQAPVDFTPDLWVLNGGCPSIRNYDAIRSSGTAVQTHIYRNPATGEIGPAAVVMNRNDAENWNTIMMTFPFFDIRDLAGTPASVPPELALVGSILGGVLPIDCRRSPTSSGTSPGEQIEIPERTVLLPNVPNPFNPTTTIRFDLAQSGKVALRIYDVAGHLVRTLVDAEMAAGRDHRVLWDGLDAQRNRVASGIYFSRLDAPDGHWMRKLVVLR